MKHGLVWLALSGLVLTAGCGGDEPGPGEELPKAKEPKQALKNLQTAIKNSDTDQFMACFDADGDEEKVLRATAEFVFVGTEFSEKMEEEYGEDALEDDQDEDSFQAMLEDDWLDEVEIEVDGDTAEVTHPDQKEPLKLVKVDGGWKIATEDTAMTPADASEKDADEAIAMVEAMTKAFKEVMPMIGKEGYTADKIKQELGMRMMAAVFPGMGEGGPGGGNGAPDGPGGAPWE